MKRFDIKVENPSKYWSDFEGESSVYGFFRWNSNSFNTFSTELVSFAWDYIRLSQKIGIAMPVKMFESIEHFENEYLQYKSEFEDVREQNPLLFIQSLNNVWLFPSLLFTDTKKAPERIISLDPFLKFEESTSPQISQSSSMPVKVALDIGIKGAQLYYYLDNDIFNFSIDNKKTKQDPEIGGKGCWVDNSDLAYLNTPRLNSFLRDLKQLCFKYGATEFEFDNLGLNNFTENGVLFNDEIVFYEDIVDLLEPHQRIVG